MTICVFDNKNHGIWVANMNKLIAMKEYCNEQPDAHHIRRYHNDDDYDVIYTNIIKKGSIGGKRLG